MTPNLLDVSSEENRATTTGEEEVGEDAEPKYLEEEDWFGNQDEAETEEQGHEVVKSEHIGGVEHEGDFYFAELGGEEEGLAEPSAADFESVHHEDRVPDLDIKDSFYFDEEYELENMEMLDVETYDDLDFEKVLDKNDGEAAAETAVDSHLLPDEDDGETKVSSSHFKSSSKEHEANEFEPWMDQEDHALMVPYDEEVFLGGETLGSEIHDEENCEECQRDVVDEENMSLTMSGLAFFGVILFLMWYMLR